MWKKVWVWDAEAPPSMSQTPGDPPTEPGDPADTSSTVMMEAEGAATNISFPGVIVAKVVIMRAGAQGAPDPDPGTPVTHYAAPSAQGTQDGSSPANAFLINDFWSVAAPGAHLQLASGTYTGANSMITPPSGVTGTSNAPITISAATPGGVLINGQVTNDPIRLIATNDYFIVEDIDAHAGRRDVFSVYGSYNIVRRCVGWDANPNYNAVVFQVSNYDGTQPWERGSSGVGNLVEDCAAFGDGRKMFQSSQYTSYTTFRRLWCLIERSPWDGNVITMSYQSHEELGENLIVTVDRPVDMVMTETYSSFGIGRIDKPEPPNTCSNHRYRGILAYSLSEQNHYRRTAAIETANNLANGCMSIKDLVVYEENGVRALLLRHAASASTADDITIIGPGVAADSVGSNWTVTNKVTSTTVAGAPTPFQATAGSGARMYYRYVDGVLTDTPLWPWPMDARIRAALTTSGRDPDTIFRGAGNSVTQLVESLFNVSLS